MHVLFMMMQMDCMVAIHYLNFSSTKDRDRAVKEKKKFKLKNEESTLQMARRDFNETN